MIRFTNILLLIIIFLSRTSCGYQSSSSLSTESSPAPHEMPEPEGPHWRPSDPIGAGPDSGNVESKSDPNNIDENVEASGPKARDPDEVMQKDSSAASPFVEEAWEPIVINICLFGLSCKSEDADEIDEGFFFRFRYRKGLLWSIS